MQKYIITALCLITLNLAGCDQQQTTQVEQTPISATVAPLSHNNIADITADLAALQSLQSLQASEQVDFRNDLLNAQHKGDLAATKQHYAQMQAFVQKYNQELEQLALASSEADQFRSQLKVFNQLALQYSQLELQEKPDEKALVELQNKLEKVQLQLSTDYTQMEKKVSAAAQPAHP